MAQVLPADHLFLRWFFDSRSSQPRFRTNRIVGYRGLLPLSGGSRNGEPILLPQSASSPESRANLAPRPILLEILNAGKLGFTYGLFLDAFKLGS